MRWDGADWFFREPRSKMAGMGLMILKNAAVLDPEKGELAAGQSVVVEGGRIADVGVELSGPDDALVIDAGGRTVMPGLIDAHTHPAVVDHDLFGMAEWAPTYVAARAARALEGMLARGFTTIRDVGGGDVGLARAVEEGYFTGPRIRYGGKRVVFALKENNMVAHHGLRRKLEKMLNGTGVHPKLVERSLS